VSCPDTLGHDVRTIPCLTVPPARIAKQGTVARPGEAKPGPDRPPRHETEHVTAIELSFSPNRLYYGDCLDVLRGWPAECVDLVYLDPPVNGATTPRQRGDESEP
jgi:hypothetical protein